MSWPHLNTMSTHRPHAIIRTRHSRSGGHRSEHSMVITGQNQNFRSKWGLDPPSWGWVMLLYLNASCQTIRKPMNADPCEACRLYSVFNNIYRLLILQPLNSTKSLNKKPNKIQEVLKEEPDNYKLLKGIANEKEKELWHPDLMRVGQKTHVLSTWLTAELLHSQGKQSSFPGKNVERQKTGQALC